MIPLDSEFVMLYLVYGILLLLIASGLFFKSNKTAYWSHLLLFFLYTGLMIYVFADKENFSGGGSLVVLVYGGLFPILHLSIYGIIELIKFSLKKRRNVLE